MAHIEKRTGKNGDTYRITVSAGYVNGKQKKHQTTWKPPAGLTARQEEKALQRAAFEFEERILQGFLADEKKTFAEYAEYAIALKERRGAKHNTIYGYKKLLPRINAAIGHIKLSSLLPSHLNTCYDNLAETGIRTVEPRATAKMDIRKLLKDKGLSIMAGAKLARISHSTLTSACDGRRIFLSKATPIAQLFDTDIKALFKIEHNDTPLSNKTIREYHSLISSILTQAERDMLVQYNAASRAIAPRIDTREASTLQPDEVIAVRDALELVPFKWKTLMHLFLLTGCRRGEIAGLKWSKIDWDNNLLKIDKTLLYSEDVGLYEDSTKTRQTRYIKLPAETMQLLKEHKKQQLELKLQNGDRWQAADYVFTRNNGLPLHPDTITNWIGDFWKKNNLPHLTARKLRHTHASLLYFNNKDSITISKRLGHSRVSTTTDIYSHLILLADEQASESVADVVLRGKNGVG